MGGARLAMIDRRDDAAVIATTLIEDGHEGRDYAISGPALVNYQELTEQLSEAIGRPVTRFCGFMRSVRSGVIANMR